MAKKWEDVVRTNPILLSPILLSHLGLCLAEAILYHEPADFFCLKVEYSLFCSNQPTLYIQKAKELFGIGIFVLFLAPIYPVLSAGWQKVSLLSFDNFEYILSFFL